MTKENGKVVMSAKVPVLGVVTGTKLLSDLAGGAAQQPSTDPAVTTKALKSASK